MRSLALHLGLLALLAACVALPAYGQGNLARIMLLAVFAMGYNLAFGYAGLLSLGHAMFFAAGMYGLGLSMEHGGLAALPAYGVGVLCAALLGAAVGALALRTTGVAFMIVTLMFAQAGYLTILHFGRWTRGDEGFVLDQAARSVAGLDLSDPVTRYWAAFALFALALLATAALVHARFGHVLIAIRENERRTEMLGYDVWRHKYLALIASATLSGASGAAYALLFGYVGASFAAVQYSIFPLLWVLLGGMGTTVGPFVGTLFMFYLIDWTSGLTSAYMGLAGLALVLLVLFARAGIMGEIRRRAAAWLP